MRLKQADISSELRGPLLVLFIVIPILAFAAVRVRDAVVRTAVFQHDVRTAQIARARALRYQLDEETGLRGFLATGETVYLEPYRAARVTLSATFDELASDLAALRIDGTAALAAQERRTNAEWVRTIAEPLRTAGGDRARTLALMHDGKRLVDLLRAQDGALQELLTTSAARADRANARAISGLLLFVVALLSALTIGAALFGFFQARSARRAFTERLRYENQKRLADSLQTAFLNKSLPNAPNLGLSATYIPATSEAQVGGDWYDAFELPDKRILFSIGDVAGHGIEAAIVMSRARQAIIAAALHENDPAMVLERANAAIFLQEARMVTAICGYIDPVSLEITYATAGHPPPILSRPPATAAYLPYDGLPLGIVADATYRTFVATASDGATFVLYTDGAVEQQRDIIGGQARLLAAVTAAAGEPDPALAIERLIFANTPPTDDVAILTVCFRRPLDAPSHASIAAFGFNRLDIAPAPAGETPAKRDGINSGALPADRLDAGVRRLLSSAPLPAVSRG